MNRLSRWWGRMAPRINSDRGELGARGERVAAKWLQKRGYRLLERNRSVGRDEADLVMIAPDGRTLVVVEVKTRHSDAPPPESNITREKRQHLSRIAARLIKQRRYAGRPVRFDVIAIVWPQGRQPQVRHHEHAFESTM